MNNSVEIINIGSTVKIVDGSYMIWKGGDTKSYPDNHYHPKDEFPGLRREVFNVIDINKPFPTNYSSSSVLTYHNNCMIKSSTTGTIWYCSRLNITLVK